MSAITLDTSRWPIVVVTYPETYTAQELKEHFLLYKDVFARGRRYVMLQDLRRSGMDSDAGVRKAAVDFATETKEISGRLCAGTVMVVSSKLVRMALQGIMLMQRPPYPYEILSDWDEAEKWARKQAANLEPTPLAKR